jgi:hypothetical protein
VTDHFVSPLRLAVHSTHAHSITCRHVLIVLASFAASMVSSPSSSAPPAARARVTRCCAKPASASFLAALCSAASFSAAALCSAAAFPAIRPPSGGAKNPYMVHSHRVSAPTLVSMPFRSAAQPVRIRMTPKVWGPMVSSFPRSA